MYGTHYSCPGYVMFWLVRAAPGHLLRLQTGRFDAPDRLFFSMKESWNSALTGTTDVKELIPEFFLCDSNFLVNRENLPLGKRQNGDVVGDVVLPSWAKGPDHFLQMHRAALESPFVSANLHHWLDLIFG
jgi:factor associated with neutral sphingomyelinase activation